MALILRHWRTWLALAVLGSAGAFGYRGDWAWCAGAVSLVLLRVACCFWRDMLATREVLRAFAETMEIAASYSGAARMNGALRRASRALAVSDYVGDQFAAAPDGLSQRTV